MLLGKLRLLLVQSEFTIVRVLHINRVVLLPFKGSNVVDLFYSSKIRACRDPSSCCVAANSYCIGGADSKKTLSRK